MIYADACSKPKLLDGRWSFNTYIVIIILFGFSFDFDCAIKNNRGTDRSMRLERSPQW